MKRVCPPQNKQPPKKLSVLNFKGLHIEFSSLNLVVKAIKRLVEASMFDLPKPTSLLSSDILVIT